MKGGRGAILLVRWEGGLIKQDSAWGYTWDSRRRDLECDSHLKHSLEFRVHFFSGRNQRLLKQTSQTNQTQQTSFKELVRVKTQRGAVSLQRSAGLVAQDTRGSSINWCLKGITGAYDCRDCQRTGSSSPQWAPRNGVRGPW